MYKVRVCNHCNNKLQSETDNSTDQASSISQSSNDLPAEYLNSPLCKESQVPAQPRDDTELRLREQDDLQLALAISLNEIENKNHLQAESSIASLSQSLPLSKNVSYTNDDKSISSLASAPTVAESEELDPELVRYLDSSYYENWKEKNKSKTTKSKPKNTVSAKSTTVDSASVKSAFEENGVSINEKVKVQDSNAGTVADEDQIFLQVLTSSLQLFRERLKKAYVESKSIVVDASIQSLFQSLIAMYPQLLKVGDETDLLRAEYESILLKLKKVEDARTHLSQRRTQYQDSLREQERRQMEFQQIQMEEKLALRRRQKQQYLRYQYEMELERQRAEEEQRLQQLQFSQQMHNQYMNRFQTSINPNLTANGDTSIVSRAQPQQKSIPPNPNQSLQFLSQQPPQIPQQSFLPSNVMQVSTQQNNGNMLPKNIKQTNLPLGYGSQSA